MDINGNNINQNEIHCLLWNEFDFINYCKNELGLLERTNFERHLSDCRECRERFLLCWNIIITDSNPEEDQATIEFLSSPLWKKKKRELARSHAQAVVSLPWKIEPQHYQSRNYFTALKVAALLLIALIPLTLTYSLLIKPYFDAHPSTSQIDVKDRLPALTKRLESTPTAPISRYDLLDRQINAYLFAISSSDSTGAAKALLSAESIAREMETRTGERFGQDLVEYYRNVTANSIEPLRQARTLCAEVETTIPHDRFSEALQKADKAKAIFEQFGASCDFEQINIQVTKYSIKTGAFAEAQTIFDTNIERTLVSRHLFSHAQFLFWQGEYLSQISNFDRAIDNMQAVIRIASPLEVPQFLLRPLMSLASIYYIMSDNERAFELAYQTLKMADTVGDPKFQIQLSQILGISAFGLKDSALAEQYLNNAIALAKEVGNNPAIAISYALLGLVQSEQHRFTEAETNFTETQQALQKIIDTKARAYLEFSATGYFARSKMLAGNIDQAINLYTRSITLAEKANIQQKLALSQLHQGLGECLMAKGDFKAAKIELAAAITLDRQARDRFEQNNSLLSFAVTRKSCYEQMDLLNRLETN
jgi:tetratricopeptide (TPR) repeat protein